MDEVRLNILKAQLNTLRQVNPIRAMEIQKSIQNELNKEINPLFNLEKAKSGIYTDTWQNRKKGVVGQKYGSEKVQDMQPREEDQRKQSTGIFSDKDAKHLKFDTSRSVDDLKSNIKRHKELLSEDTDPTKKKWREGVIKKFEKELKDKQSEKKEEKQQPEKEVEHTHNLKEADRVRISGGRFQRVVEIIGNMVRLDGEQHPVHISKLYRPDGSAVLSEKKEQSSSQGKHISDMSNSEKLDWAKKLGIQNPEKLSTTELNKQLVGKNIENEMAKFKNRSK